MKLSSAAIESRMVYSTFVRQISTRTETGASELNLNTTGSRFSGRHFNLNCSDFERQDR